MKEVFRIGDFWRALLWVEDADTDWFVSYGSQVWPEHYLNPREILGSELYGLWRTSEYKNEAEIFPVERHRFGLVLISEDVGNRDFLISAAELELFHYYCDESRMFPAENEDVLDFIDERGVFHPEAYWQSLGSKIKNIVHQPIQWKTEGF